MARRLGEFDRIARYFRPLAAGLPGAFGLTDDAGCLDVPAGHQLVVTSDAMVEGIHYLAGEAPDGVARKLLRVNLSDLAAMGARPLAYTLTTALPQAVGEAWLETFAAGLAADQARFGIHLLGGDSVSTTGPVMASLTAFGTAAAGAVLRRSGARVGDLLYVSGTPGDAALGLEAARGGLGGTPADARAALEQRYRMPEPRLALGQGLVGLASAAIDLSDGLPGDLAHICLASSVGAVVRAPAMPFSAAARAALASHPDLLATALAGGDDYELLFTAPPAAEAGLRALGDELGLPLTAIGEIVPGDRVTVLDAAGRPIVGLRGWQHF